MTRSGRGPACETLEWRGQGAGREASYVHRRAVCTREPTGGERADVIPTKSRGRRAPSVPLCARRDEERQASGECTFWRAVTSDQPGDPRRAAHQAVLMHLLARDAFCPHPSAPPADQGRCDGSRRRHPGSANAGPYVDTGTPAFTSFLTSDEEALRESHSPSARSRRRRASWWMPSPRGRIRPMGPSTPRRPAAWRNMAECRRAQQCVHRVRGRRPRARHRRPPARRLGRGPRPPPRHHPRAGRPPPRARRTTSTRPSPTAQAR